jgi:hypothetical protein
MNMQVSPERKYLIVETLQQVYLQHDIRYLLCVRARFCSLTQNLLCAQITGWVPLRHGWRRRWRRSGAEASRRWHCCAGVVCINHFGSCVPVLHQHRMILSLLLLQGSTDAVRAAADIVLTEKGLG